MIGRRKTRPVDVGGLTIGGGAPVSVQSMTNTKTADTNATLAQIRLLAAAGCELIRVAVPDRDAARALGVLIRESPVPLVADIHFDVRLAYLSLEQGAAKVRVNPGNLGSKVKLLELARRARAGGAALRIGVNAGSLERPLLEKYGGATAEALVESALRSLETLEKIDFHDLVVSLKSSDVPTAIFAYRMIAEQVAYPLHLGITGAGTPETGAVKAAVGIGTLLAEGIGDTIRVSLTANPLEEVRVGRRILQALGLRRFGPELVSCPTCGRCEVDLVPLAEEVAELLKGYAEPLTVAVMGCAVNGPGEAREADLGVSAGRKRGIIFRKGKVIKTVSPDQILPALGEELNRLLGPGNRSGERDR